MIDINKLYQLLKSGDAKKIAHYMENHNLIIKDGRITYSDNSYVEKQISFWDKRQLVKKINLNS